MIHGPIAHRRVGMDTAFRAPTDSVFCAICTILFRSVLSRIWAAGRQGRKWYTWGAACGGGPGGA